MAIMQVSRKIDYALRAVIHLANEENSERACSVMAETISETPWPMKFTPAEPEKSKYCLF